MNTPMSVQAPRFVIKGADLMMPGCIQPEGGYGSTSMDVNQVWAVRCQGNPLPFCVGQIAMTNEELQTATRGKLVEIIHVLDDAVMGLVEDIEFPEGFTANTCVPVSTGAAEPEIDKPETAEGTAAQQEEQGEPKGGVSKSETAEATGEAENAMKFPPCAVDALIEVVLYDVLKKTVTNAQLPMDVSAIWGRVSQAIPGACKTCEDQIAEFMAKRGITIGSVTGRAEAEDESDDCECARVWDVKLVCVNLCMCELVYV